VKSALEHDHRQRKGGARQALAVNAVASAERERLVSEVIANEAARAASVIWCRHRAALPNYQQSLSKTPTRRTLPSLSLSPVLGSRRDPGLRSSRSHPRCRWRDGPARLEGVDDPLGRWQRALVIHYGRLLGVQTLGTRPA